MICPHCGREFNAPKASPNREVQNIQCASIFLGFSGKEETCVLQLGHGGTCESVQSMSSAKPQKLHAAPDPAIDSTRRIPPRGQRKASR